MAKTVQFQTIPFNVSTQLTCQNSSIQANLFSVSTQFKCKNSKFSKPRLFSIRPIDRTLSGATIPGQSGHGSDGSEGVLWIPQSSSITGTSRSDCLVSYPGHSLWGTVPLCKCAVGILYSTSRLGNIKSMQRIKSINTKKCRQKISLLLNQICINEEIVPKYKHIHTRIYIYIYHHHHVALVARISLTLSRHSSLSLIAPGRSSGQHPVSSHSCWVYVRAGRPIYIYMN